MRERPKTTRPGMPERVNFLQELVHRVRQAPSRGDRTRYRFMELATRELAKRGHRPLRARTLNKLAGTAQGTFYSYFRDARDVEAAVWSLFMEHRLSVLGPLISARDLFSATRFTVDVFTEHYRLNASVYRAFMPMVDRDPRFASIWDKGNMSLVDILVNDLMAVDVTRDIPRPLLQGAMVMAYSILDENLYAIYGVGRASRLASIVKDVDSFTELAALLIHRALFGTAPDAARLTFARPLLETVRLERQFVERAATRGKPARAAAS